jgi:hypothetical protein
VRSVASIGLSLLLGRHDRAPSVGVVTIRPAIVASPYLQPLPKDNTSLAIRIA